MRLVSLLIFEALVLSFCLAFGGQAWAHRLSVFAYVEGPVIHVESKFGGGRPCQGCEVLATSAAGGGKLASGLTDAQGRVQFELAEKPTADTLITIASDGGHQGAWTLAASEFAQFEAKPGPKAAPAATPAPVAAPTASPAAEPAAQTPTPAAQAQPCPPALDEALLRKLLSEELEKKIAPMRAMLLDSKLAGPSMVEIAGGIGYIFGLAGLAVLLKSRKK